MTSQVEQMEVDQNQGSGDSITLTRANIRHEYRQLIHEVEENQEELIRPDNDKLKTKITIANQIFKSVRDTREAALDSKLMACVASTATKRVSNTDTNIISFDPVNYLNKITSSVESSLEEEDLEKDQMNFWKTYSKMTYSCWKSIVPTTSPLSGTFGNLFQRKPRQQRRKPDVIEKEKKPLQIINKRNKNKETTPEEIERVNTIIRNSYDLYNQTPLHYWELVTDVTSFGRTVESMFHLSFLEKEGMIRIYEDQEMGLPVVVPLSESESLQVIEKRKRDKGGACQMVATITIEDWEGIIDAYKLKDKEPLIPPISS